GDVDHAERMQVHLVGMRGDVVLALVVARAPGDDLLAARLEAVDRGGDLAQRREARRPHLVEDDDEARDLRILACGVERVEDVAQLHLLHRLAAHLIERSRAQVAALLLADRAVDAQDERGLVGQGQRSALGEGDDHRDQDDHEEQVQDDAPTDVDDAPGAAEEPAHGAGIRRGHGRAVQEKTASLSDCSKAARLARAKACNNAQYCGRMQAILAVTIPFFALVLLGWFAARAYWLPESAIPGLNAYVLFFALPCMLFRFGSSLPIGRLADPVLLAVYVVSALAIIALTIAVTVRRAGRSNGVTLRDAAFGALVAAFPNAGFMGVPLLVALLGE